MPEKGGRTELARARFGDDDVVLVKEGAHPRPQVGVRDGLLAPGVLVLGAVQAVERRTGVCALVLGLLDKLVGRRAALLLRPSFERLQDEAGSRGERAQRSRSVNVDRRAAKEDAREELAVRQLLEVGPADREVVRVQRDDFGLVQVGLDAARVDVAGERADEEDEVAAFDELPDRR